MKITKRKVKITLEFNVPTYTADDGTKFELTDEQLINKLTSKGIKYIDEKIINKKSDCKILDRKFQFNSFNYNCDALIYDETNKETYEHFIHHYLKKYYVDSRNSRHSTNGGNWQHDSYDIELGLHNNMLNQKFKKTDPTALGVKDLILIHLMSGEGVRMYGTGMYYRSVKQLKTFEDQKEFWKWIFDSKMFNPNDPVIVSSRVSQILKINNHYERWFTKYKTIGHLIINKCWRDDSLEVLKWIVDEYQLDLYTVEKLHPVNVDISYSNSLYYDIINDIHDKRIHDTYNNGVLSRLYEYNGKLKTKAKLDDSWKNIYFNILVEYLKFINDKWPLLKLESSSNYVSHPNITKYTSLEDCFRNGIFEEPARSDEGTLESYELLISAICK